MLASETVRKLEESGEHRDAVMLRLFRMVRPGAEYPGFDGAAYVVEAALRALPAPAAIPPAAPFAGNGWEPLT